MRQIRHRPTTSRQLDALRQRTTAFTVDHQMKTCRRSTADADLHAPILARDAIRYVLTDDRPCDLLRDEDANYAEATVTVTNLRTDRFKETRERG